MISWGFALAIGERMHYEGRGSCCSGKKIGTDHLFPGKKQFCGSIYEKVPDTIE
jgi:hypothetical protein